MAPIHDSDLAEDRWSKAAWDYYELWEITEQKIHRQKRLWMLGTVVVFLVLSAVPIIAEKMPKWASRDLTRQLAQVLNRVKRAAIHERGAVHLRFLEASASPQTLLYVLEKFTVCPSLHSASTAPVPQEVVERLEQGVLQGLELGGLFGGERYQLLTPAQGLELGVPGLVDSFCYDARVGAQGLEMDAKATTANDLAFAVVSVKDFTERRVDRLSLLLLSGSLAEMELD